MKPSAAAQPTPLASVLGAASPQLSREVKTRAEIVMEDEPNENS